ncbi:hypothetical protein Tco_0827654 [Tanacetum coccineum]
MLPSEARMMTSVWIPSDNSLPKNNEPGSIADTTGNNLVDDSRPNVTDHKPGEQRDSTKPSDKITQPARPSRLRIARNLSEPGFNCNTTRNITWVMIQDLIQIESNEAAGSSCTTKGDCDVTSSPPDP